MAGTTIEGTVTRTSGNGLQLAEQPGEWINVSKYTHNGDAIIPPVGTRVQLTLDASNFIRKIAPLGQQAPQAAPAPPTEAIAHTADQKDLRITRLACLNTAVNLLYGSTGRGKVHDVLEVAEALESWVLR